MAESEYAGQYGGVITLTCILDEGAPTVSDRMYGTGGTYEKGHTWASELRKDDVVTLSGETSNTYEACRGMPVVEAVSDGDDKVVGKILSSPRLVVTPPSTTGADTLTKRLDGQYYRVASVEIWAGVTAVMDAHLLRTNTAAVVPGVLGILDVDVSQSNTDHDFVLNDAAAGAGFMSFHYVAQGAAASYTILVGVVALGTAAT